MPLKPDVRTLPGGLRLIVSRDDTAPVVAVCLWIRAGSRDDPAGKTGLAHLFEHLMFQGSTHVPANGHTAAIEDGGGFTNASTGFERTTFYSVVPAGMLDLVLWLEADRLGGMLDALTPESLDNQRDVVLNERRERYDNVPYGTGWERLLAQSFPPGHPFRDLPAGRPEDLATVTEEDCRAFFRRHYRPDRALLAVVGDVDPDAVAARVERHFGHLPPSPPEIPTEPWPTAPRPPVEPRRRLTERAPGPALMGAYQLPPHGQPAGEAADLAVTLLGGMSSRGLHHRLVRADQLAHRARASLMPLYAAPSLCRLDVRALPGADLAHVEKAVDEETERLVESGVTAAALKGGQAQLRRDWLDRLAHPGSRAEELCAQEAYLGNAAGIDERLDRLAALTAEEVSAAAAAYLAPENRAVLTYEPSESGAAV
ncbi:insulinase family protein [Streptomyces coelicoflavus]|uniref:Insulinase family protein n=1 Tax=Streptomyces coelicoflavus TaxID=285562 RepID=A0A7K3PQ17_9ACTN|nr:insulinase family protein [Streptomyces coelicoflavus]